MNPSLVAQGLSIPHGDEAGPGFDLAVPESGCLCLLSTCSNRLTNYLRTLAGIASPSAGDLQLLGQAPFRMDEYDWLEQRPQLAYVAHDTALLSVMRVLDNVMLPLLYHRKQDAHTARTIAEQRLQETGFEGDPRSLPAYLNHLQILQAALARATVLEPAILYLQEPFAGMLHEQRHALLPFIRQYSEQHLVILATRQVQVAQRLQPQVLFLGDDEVLHFEQWRDFLASEHTCVQDYLHTERRHSL